MTTTTTAQTLTTLHALHTKWVAAGLPEVWPEMVTLDTESNPEAIPLYGYKSGMPWAIMDPADALAIVEKRWEEALVERGWLRHCSKPGWMVHKADPYMEKYIDLLAAIEAEISRKMEETKR